MIVADFTKLISFIPQYIVATLAGVYVFYILRKKRFYSRPEFIVMRNHRQLFLSMELLGMSFYSSLEKIVSQISFSLFPAYAGVITGNLRGSDLRSVFRKDSLPAGTAEFVRRNRTVFKAPSTRVKFPEIYLRRGIYDAYTYIFPISVWAGVLLLLTPYQKIFIFIPHFSSLAVNLSIIIVLSITIFEGTLSALFLFIGTSRKTVAAVMAGVMGIFSASLLTPSFTWFHIYTLSGELLVYSILGVLILSITFLIAQFKDKSILFKLTLYSSFVSYGFFITVTGYNIVTTLMHAI